MSQSPYLREVTRTAGAPPRNSQRAMRRPLLVALAAAAVAFAGTVWANWWTAGYPQIAQASAWISERGEQVRTAALMRNDPRVGTVLPDPLPPEAAGASGTVRLIVFGGPPTSCCTERSIMAAKAFTRDVRRALPGSNVSTVLVLEGPNSAAGRYDRREKRELRVAADPSGILSRRYNAFWTPRAYAALDGRLRWIQRGPEMGAPAVVGALIGKRPPLKPGGQIANRGVLEDAR